MTGSYTFFRNISHPQVIIRLRTAGGCLSAIARTGTISCSSSITLSSVLHIPKFSHNLLSISSITMCLIALSHSFQVIVFSGTENGKND